MKSSGLPLALTARTRKGFTLFWAAIFVMSLVMQYTAAASPSPVLAAPGDPSVAAYDQCSNDLGTGYTSGNLGCRWINGNLQANNSTYPEGDATVQRLWLDNLLPATTHTITFQYGTTKAGKHAYDFLTTWDWSENWITAADRCEDITGCVAASTESTLAIPVDPNAGGFDAAAGTRQFVMRGGTFSGSATTPTLVSGSYAGDSETEITVTIDVPASGAMCTTQGNITCGVVIWFGAHVARQADWGDGTGAGNIPGSPYHVALSAVNALAIGKRDNQMQAGAVIAAPTLSITKTADAPSVNAGSPIGFTITVTNAGPGIATGVTATDTLPTGSGIAWSESPDAAGWAIASKS